MSYISVLSETPPASPSGMDAMLKEQVVEFAMSCFNTITANPILAFIFAGSLVGVGISVFRQFKNAAR